MLVGIMIMLCGVIVGNLAILYTISSITHAMNHANLDALEAIQRLETAIERLNGHHSGLIEVLNRRETINSSIQPAQPQAIQVFKGP